MEIERFRRGNRGAVLALLDIDHFKSVNDSYGHPAGDTVLQAVTRACTSHLRANDCFGRLGGEEFGILLSETDEEGGKLAAEKIRKMIADQLMPVGGGIRVTASFGLSALGGNFDTAARWVAEADQALYRAKGAGRNCCVVARSMMPKE